MDSKKFNNRPNLDQDVYSLQNGKSEELQQYTTQNPIKTMIDELPGPIL